MIGLDRRDATDGMLSLNRRSDAGRRAVSIERSRRDRGLSNRGMPKMTLEFLNPSRSFDEVRHAVRFIGHDGMSEVPFFVEAAALAAPGGALPSKRDSLAAFDAARSRIHDVARNAYSRRRRTPCTLTAADFR